MNRLKKIIQLARLMTIALCIMLTHTSCEKEDEKEEGVILLERSNQSAYHNHSTYTLYEYDAQRRITKRSVYYYPEILYSAYTLTYYVDRILLEYQSGETTTFIKNGNKISIDYGGYQTVEIELNAQGLPVKQTSIQVYGSSYWEMQTSTFAWENGNLIQQGWEQYREEDGIESYSIGTVTYTYDTMKSPFYNCTTPKWFLMYLLGINYCSMNNMETAKSSEKYSSKYGANSYVSTQTMENTYNDGGFLATRKNAADTSIHGQSFQYTNQ